MKKKKVFNIENTQNTAHWLQKITHGTGYLENKKYLLSIHKLNLSDDREDQCHMHNIVFEEAKKREKLKEQLKKNQ